MSGTVTLRRRTRTRAAPTVRHYDGLSGGWFIDLPRGARFGPYPDEARAKAVLELLAYDAWRAVVARGECPHDIPEDPHLVYTHEFKGYADWLGWLGEKD